MKYLTFTKWNAPTTDEWGNPSTRDEVRFTPYPADWDTSMFIKDSESEAHGFHITNEDFSLVEDPSITDDETYIKFEKETDPWGCSMYTFLRDDTILDKFGEIGGNGTDVHKGMDVHKG